MRLATIGKSGLVLTVGVCLGWVALSSAVVNEFGQRSPAVASKLRYPHPKLKTSSALREFRLKQGVVASSTVDEAVAALPHAPLSDEPFALAGVLRMQEGDFAQGRLLLEEARRRNPRSRLAHLMLLGIYMKIGATQPAISEMAALARLVPEVSRVLVPELAKYVGDKDTRGIAIKVVRTNHSLRDELLSHLIRNDEPTELILDIAGPLARVPGSVPPAWQTALLNALVAKGDVNQAGELWVRFSGLSQPPRGSIYDPAFKGLPGLAPFNWNLGNSAAGVAEHAPGGGMEITYYGRETFKFAEQLLRLAPGAYKFEVSAEGDVSKGGDIGWEITCAPSGARIMSLPMRKLSNAPGRFGSALQVANDGCSGQWLRLNGAPSEFPGTSTLRVSAVSIQKASR